MERPKKKKKETKRMREKEKIKDDKRKKKKEKKNEDDDESLSSLIDWTSKKHCDRYIACSMISNRYPWSINDNVLLSKKKEPNQQSKTKHTNIIPIKPNRRRRMPNSRPF